MSVLVQREAAEIREEWLGLALSTLPADRPAAEAAISELYGLIGLAPPRFHWVSSPAAALATVPPGIRLRPSESVDRMADWPVPPRLVRLMRDLCRELDSQVRWVHQPMDQLIRQEVRSSLARSSDSALVRSLRAAHDSPYHPATAWYGAQCVSWVAHYDALRRVAGVVFTPEQNRRLEPWAVVARSCGWWWPREGVCVISERPVTLHTEVWGDAGEVRLHRADGPAIRYADGWDAYAWHGTTVPSWVVTDPSVRRIDEEPNVEVRRCAIEHIGWASYIDQARLRLVGSAPDPGNPGSQLRLYDMRKETRVLLAVNGSVERDGHRRRYGLTVPGFFDDPIAAAGWTYGLSAEQYSLLVRRT
ncbi:DUF6745 domain-containing protein [Actinomadura sp. HBU206391]|uniref:DUF6745 domain-containing protein n=1 Tax=Actinomadura sp. HBU206391 TaxID=2731692 RepID=UPI001C9CB4EA|nr:hypothetical protein [Actinomadura sp. HBU206391]